LKFIKKFIAGKINEIRAARVHWRCRDSISIKASTNGTTYDRYDPARGLHKPYEVEE